MGELDEALSALDGDIEEAKMRLTAAQAAVEELISERKSLIAAISRVRSRSVLNTEVDQWWQGLSRTDAVEAVLRRTSVAMSPAQITEQLVRHGRSDEADLVSAALSYLKKTGRAESPSYGKWLPPITDEASILPPIEDLEFPGPPPLGVEWFGKEPIA